MYITVRMSDGKKITGDIDRLIFFSPSTSKWCDEFDIPAIKDGCITINIDQVLYARMARDDEIEHAKIHGW